MLRFETISLSDGFFHQYVSYLINFYQYGLLGAVTFFFCLNGRENITEMAL